MFFSFLLLEIGRHPDELLAWNHSRSIWSKADKTRPDFLRMRYEQCYHLKVLIAPMPIFSTFHVWSNYSRWMLVPFMMHSSVTVMLPNLTILFFFLLYSKPFLDFGPDCVCVSWVEVLSGSASCSLNRKLHTRPPLCLNNQQSQWTDSQGHRQVQQQNAFVLS